MKLAFI